MITAEILSTGDEVLLGDIDDSNASWLARRLRESGIEVRRTSCVGDDVKDISKIMREISGRVDIVLVTGGLGPTSDDLSAEAAALASGDLIVLNEDALASMEGYFKEKRWQMSDSNKKQAMLPSKAGIMENSCGTAPGFHVAFGNALFFFMPGVPKEMKAMYELSVLPFIKKQFSIDTSFLMTRLKLFGLPESRVSSQLKGFHDRFPELKLGFRASFPLIEVKFSKLIHNRELIHDRGLTNDSGLTYDSEFVRPEKQVEEARQWVASRLEGFIISQEGLNMEQEVGALLAQQGKSIAVAESCTGGLIADMLTDVAGSSDYFLMSAVTYSNEAKIKVLGVKPDTIAANGAVHELTAQEMAQGVRELAGADYGLSTSGIAGPGGGSEDKPVGTVCIGIAGKNFAKAYRFQFGFADRSMNKKIFAVKALDLLRRKICKD